MNLGHLIVKGAVCLNTLAAFAYLFNGDLPRAVYWAAAALLTGSTIFIK